MINFHGAWKTHSFFEGWYLKHQNNKRTVALIPAYHVDACGNASSSLQVITDRKAYRIPFEGEDFWAAAGEFKVRIEDNLFWEKGISVNLRTEDVTVKGKLRYGPFSKLGADIMGPFHYIPFMQCNHGVLSMAHSLEGKLAINDEVIDFTGGIGYVEKDWGDSFPRDYLWTQCNWRLEHGGCGSVMISAADIPWAGRHFTGCIAAVMYEGREFRFATYKCVKILKLSRREILLKQGKYWLRALVLEEKPQKLRAPAGGGMTRTIRESPACKVRYCFGREGHVIFDVKSENAGFEAACRS